MVVLNAQLSKIVHATNCCSCKASCEGNVDMTCSFSDAESIESEYQDYDGHEEGESSVAGIVQYLAFWITSL